MRPVIGIMAHLNTGKGPFGHSHTGNTYVLSVSKAGGIPVIIPTILSDEEQQKLIGLFDGFLFSGGIDISPSFYGEDAHLKLGLTNSSLDQLQIPFLQKVLKTGKPVLGICRGNQVLNVACGGTLYQDLSEIPGTYLKHFQETKDGDISHHVSILPDSILSRLYGSEIMVNSYHHQAVKDCGRNIEPIAYSPDGVVEAIQLKDYPYGLGVQWHPETMFATGDASMRPLFESFIQACAGNTNRFSGGTIL